MIDSKTLFFTAIPVQQSYAETLVVQNAQLAVFLYHIYIFKQSMLLYLSNTI